MYNLNYHHLYYFYITAKEGSISRASELLHITPQTISGQITTLEQSLNQTLFDRRGKRLILNNRGKIAFSYAQDIFSLGNELVEQLHQGRLQQTFTIGITDVVPKVFALDLVQPILPELKQSRLVFKEGDLSSLLADLALNKIDLILTDRPMSQDSNVKAYSHFLGSCGVSFFASESLISGLSGDFPECLAQQPLLISSQHSKIHYKLANWLEQKNIQCHIMAEFDDSALLKLFGQEGYGIFCAPQSIAAHVTQQYRVKPIGHTDEITESYYLISPERRIKHPMVLKISETAGDII